MCLKNMRYKLYKVLVVPKVFSTISSYNYKRSIKNGVNWVLFGNSRLIQVNYTNYLKHQNAVELLNSGKLTNFLKNLISLSYVRNFFKLDINFNE